MQNNLKAVIHVVAVGILETGNPVLCTAILFQNTHMPVAGMPVLETFRKVVRKIMTAMLVSFPTSLAVYYQNLVTYTGYSHLPESEISFCELPSCVSQA